MNNFSRRKISRLALAAFAAGSLATPALAKQSSSTYLRFGTGSYSCAKALSDNESYDSFIWVMGYFSGLNRVLFNQVGRSTDGEGIFAEVKMLCNAEPSTKLVDAVDRVYDRMGKQGL